MSLALDTESVETGDGGGCPCARSKVHFRDLASSLVTGAREMKTALGGRNEKCPWGDSGNTHKAM